MQFKCFNCSAIVECRPCTGKAVCQSCGREYVILRVRGGWLIK